MKLNNTKLIIITKSVADDNNSWCCKFVNNCTRRLLNVVKKKENIKYVLLRTFVERKIRIKYIKCAKSAVKQKWLQFGFENVQRDVRWPKFSR